MLSISDPAAGIQPAGIEAYSHLLRFNRRRLFTDAEIAWLREHADSVEFARRRRHPQSVDRHHIYITRPDAEALRWLARQPYCRLYYVELALDLIFATEAERDRAYVVIDRYFYKKRHPAWHGIRYVRRTRYSGPRGSATVATIYPDLPSCVTGEIFTVHIEWRVRSADALRRVGIRTAADLITFDHHNFWRQRLLLWDLDRARLLSLYIAHSRDPTLHGFSRRQIGRRLFTLLPTTQRIIDALRPRRLDRALLLTLYIERSGDPTLVGFTRQQIGRRLFALLPTTQGIIDALRPYRPQSVSIPVQRAVQVLAVDHLLPLPDSRRIDKGRTVASTTPAPSPPPASAPFPHRSPSSSQPRNTAATNVGKAHRIGSFLCSPSPLAPLACRLYRHPCACTGIVACHPKTSRRATDFFGSDRDGFLWQQHALGGRDGVLPGPPPRRAAPHPARRLPLLCRTSALPRTCPASSPGQAHLRPCSLWQTIHAPTPQPALLQQEVQTGGMA